MRAGMRVTEAWQQAQGTAARLRTRRQRGSGLGGSAGSGLGSHRRAAGIRARVQGTGGAHGRGLRGM